MRALEGAYHVPEARVVEAIAGRGSFNLIHLATMLKVDVFVSKERPFDDRAFDRAVLTPLEGGGVIPVSSAEDTLLAKLEWFRRGGERSERQWTDVRGLLQTPRTVDLAYLRHGAIELGVSDLLDRLLREAGLEP
jgi:hypothetical protein